MNKCPKCGESPWGDAGFQTELPEEDGGEMWQQVKCLKCGFAWNVVYKFSHYEDADTLEVIDEGE